MKGQKLLEGEYICPVCKKVFYMEEKSYWAYKDRYRNDVRYVCTWSCLSDLRNKEQRKKNHYVRTQMA